MLQKIFGRLVEKRPAGDFRSSGYSYKTTIEQDLHDAVDRHASDGLDIGASDWLAIGDDREGFQLGTGEAGRFRFRIELADPGRSRDRRVETPTVDVLDEIKRVSRLRIILVQFAQHGSHVSLPHARMTPRHLVRR